MRVSRDVVRSILGEIPDLENPPKKRLDVAERFNLGKPLHRRLALRARDSLKKFKELENQTQKPLNDGVGHIGTHKKGPAVPQAAAKIRRLRSARQLLNHLESLPNCLEVLRAGVIFPELEKSLGCRKAMPAKFYLNFQTWKTR